jgi:hypothetical protein
MGKTPKRRPETSIWHHINRLPMNNNNPSLIVFIYQIKKFVVNGPHEIYTTSAS